MRSHPQRLGWPVKWAHLPELQVFGKDCVLRGIDALVVNKFLQVVDVVVGTDCDFKWRRIPLYKAPKRTNGVVRHGIRDTFSFVLDLC